MWNPPSGDAQPLDKMCKYSNTGLTVKHTPFANRKPLFACFGAYIIYIVRSSEQRRTEISLCIIRFATANRWLNAISVGFGS